MRFNMPIRRYVTHTAEGVSSIEANFGYVHRNVDLDSDQTALVLVDCWDYHYIESWLARAKEVMTSRLAPLAAVCRDAGVLVIHAPGRNVAERYADWMEDPGDWNRNQTDGWPPADFAARAAPYEDLHWASEPAMSPELADWMDYSRNRMMIYRDVVPVAGDAVIATGDQLHALLRKRGILHLIYAGFATNWCVLNKDYGFRAMTWRGYNGVILRDGTTALETHESYTTEQMRDFAVLTMEMTMGYSSTVEELIGSLRSVADPTAATALS